ncbi:MAG: NAD(P)/FAD-dependent oxidoreductase [Leptolyngbyaceae cyanobacterium bins.349]|nr:NAD(P)/FAD-dependent oxidoreductase [Leptolyngbyaceae cyanobacterium bins.349]
MKRPQVVVVGAGFGGMQAARSLMRSGVEVLLIDRHNYNTFVPLLYQVAFAQLEPGLIAYPVRTLFRRYRRVRFLMDSVEQIDLTQKWVKTTHETISYDYLILATGSQARVVNLPGVAQHGWMLRTLDEAIALRNHTLTCFERAAHEVDEFQRQQLLTFVIVGGGATGVEVAGALVELSHSLIRRDYPMLRRSDVRIVMLQSGDRLLPDLPSVLGTYTLKKLRHLGVDIHLEATVTQVTDQAVYLHNRQSIATETVIWTAGLEAALPDVVGTVEQTNRRKLTTLPTLQLANYPDVYALGDVAAVQATPLTGVAPEALQAGVMVARNIRRQIKGRSPKPFHYFNKGRLAIIGCYSGVGKIAGMPFGGFLAWFMWLAVHLIYLPGYRNRLLVLLSWVQAFILGDRAARTIVPVTTLSHLGPVRNRETSTGMGANV